MDDRYKKRGLKFNNNLDSRVLRAVHNQQRQRGRRDDAVNQRRQLGALEDSPQVACPPKILVNNAEKEAERKQKGLERYHELLKWKEMKKKQLEKEKKKRMPAFKTGIYQPSPPKYLVSGDQKESGKTPQASVKKRVATPGVSLRKVPVFHLGCTPGTSLRRMPQFHTGLTPSVSTRKQVLTTRKENKQQDQAGARRTRGAHKKENTMATRRIGARGRATRHRKPNEHEDLGVQPLPLTPTIAVSQSKMEKPLPSLQGLSFPSFAPADFAFKFEVPRSECPPPACPDDPMALPCRKEAPQDQIHDKKEACVLKELVESKLMEDIPAHQKNASFQENDTKILEARECEVQRTIQDDSSLQEEKDGDISKTNESEIKIANQENFLQDKDAADISEINESEMQAENQDNSSLQEEKDADTLEINENEMPPANQDDSSLQEEKDPCISEVSERAFKPVNQENLSLQEDADSSQSNLSETHTANQEKALHKQDKHVDISQTNECKMELESDPKNVDEILTNESPENFSDDKSSETENHPELSSIAEVQDGENSKPKKIRRAATPAKYLTRRSVACCFDGTVTPTVSRLRPRTPCSRSTRRSLSAHCDSPWEMYTPSKQRSARKTPRASVNKTTKLKDLQETHDTVLLPEVTAARSLYKNTDAEMVNTLDQTVSTSHLLKITKVDELKESGSPLLTPENVFRREQGMWTVETSPWINNAPRSKKKNKKVSDLHGMFDDIPTDGSPIPSHLIPSAPVSNTTEASISEDTVCSNLLPLLQPSTPHNPESPGVDVWGESPVPNVLGTLKTSKLLQSPQDEKVLPVETLSVLEDVETNDIKVSGPTTKDVVGPDSPLVAVNTLIPCVNGDAEAGHRTKAKKSRKSVMFAVAEQENMKINKLPATPVHTSTRVSMGLFAKVDLNVEHPINENQDLILFDTPKSEKKTACTRRKSARISLLPGMTPSPVKEVSVPVSADLITWDSPQPRRTSRFAASSLATPVRRSRRLSKAV